MHPIGRAVQKRSLFKEKVVVCKENFVDVQTDVVINFCAPNILSGPSFFTQIHKMAGPNLMNVCEQFRGMAPTFCRVTNAFDATNFKLIVHSVVPVPLDLQRPIDLRKMYLCVRNALDTSAEEGATTIAFPSYLPGVDLKLGCDLILRIFTDWIHRSFYSDQISEIKVICPTEKEYHYFVNAAKNLYSEAEILNQSYVSQFMRPSTVVVPSRYLHNGYSHRPRRTRRTYDPPLEPAPIKLELSAKLAPTILVIDDINGLKRQYRLTNRSRDGRKLYFRCSRCDTLIKKDGQRIRAKLIVQDGHIVSDRYPEHHPDCEAKTHEDVFMQQIDRSSRREVKEGYLLPQEAYKKAINRVLEETAQDPSVDGAVERFPEWPRLRQQYCRIRKTAIGKRYREHNDNQDYVQPSYGRPKKVKYSPAFDPATGLPLPVEDGGMIDYVDMDVVMDDAAEYDPAAVAEAELMDGKIVKNDVKLDVEDDNTIINVDDDLTGAHYISVSSNLSAM